MNDEVDGDDGDDGQEVEVDEDELDQSQAAESEEKSRHFCCHFFLSYFGTFRNLFQLFAIDFGLFPSYPLMSLSGERECEEKKL